MHNNININFNPTFLVTKLIELHAEIRVIFDTQAQIISVLEKRKVDEVHENMMNKAKEIHNIIKKEFMKENKELFDEKFISEHPEIFEE